MSVTSILEARRLGTTRATTRPPEEASRHDRVRAAIGTVLEEVDRLRRLEKRAEDRRRARAETTEITARALRRAAHREATKHLLISIDKKWFWGLAEAYLRTLHGAAFDAFKKDLEQIDDRERRLAGGGQ